MTLPAAGSVAPGAAAGPAGHRPRRALDVARAAVTAAVSALVPDTADAPLILAVSGGRDSTALALAARPLGSRAHVVHVDHGLRPDSSADARFVCNLAARLGLEATVLSAPPTDDDLARGETAARRRRLAALGGAARRLGARWILLAHHLDDDLETIGLHLRRGHRGDRAAAGMPAWRPLDLTEPADTRVHLLRPFLFGPAPLGRADLARVVSEEGDEHREDPTNADLAIPRNALRARLAGDAALGADLLALRATSRRRLAARLAHVAACLERHLRPQGLGARLDARALVPRAGDGPEDHSGELLRLLGASLLRPRRVDLRRAVVARVADLARRGRGELLVPAQPAPLRMVGARDALCLPDEPLPPVTPAARVLRALLAVPPPGSG